MEEAVGIFRLNGDLRNGAVVDAAGEDATVVVAQVGNILLRFPHRVVEAVVAEEVEILHAA